MFLPGKNMEDQKDVKCLNITVIKMTVKILYFLKIMEEWGDCA